jgi:hypothetical protein
MDFEDPFLSIRSDGSGRTADPSLHVGTVNEQIIVTENVTVVNARAFAAGGLVFDINMDIGGMRDLHRHRRCTQIFQAYDAHAWAIPEGVNLPVEFKYAMNVAQKNFEIMQKLQEVGSQNPSVAAYLLPLGAKRRFLMKMAVAEVEHISTINAAADGTRAEDCSGRSHFLAARHSQKACRAY